MTDIKFFDNAKGKNYWRFSNFAELPIKIDGIVFPTSEHYFQSAKFFKLDPEYAEKIRMANTPKTAKKLGKDRNHPIDPIWDVLEDGELLMKDLVMKRALKAKAEQHPDFLEDLISTGDANIIEASPWDNYWGSGRKGNGKNMLGKLLVELRDSYKDKPSKTKNWP